MCAPRVAVVRLTFLNGHTLGVGQASVMWQSCQHGHLFWPRNCREPGPVEGPDLTSGHPVVHQGWALPGLAPSSKPWWNSPFGDGQTFFSPKIPSLTSPHRVDFLVSCSLGTALHPGNPSVEAHGPLGGHSRLPDLTPAAPMAAQRRDRLPIRHR